MASQKETRAAPSTAAPRNAPPPSTAAPRSAAPSAAAARNTENTKTTSSNEEIYRLIAETAYFKAKARGFAPGGEVRDWIEAEAEIRNRMERGAR